MLKNPPLIIDNTVLGNLHSADQLSLITELFSCEVWIPREVVLEGFGRRDLSKEIKRVFSDEYIYASNTIEELDQFSKLYNRMKDAGDAAVITLSFIHGGTICTDNLSDFEYYVERYEIDLMTTIGVLHLAHKENAITRNEGQGFIDKMIQDGNKLPVKSFEEIISFFDDIGGVHNNCLDDDLLGYVCFS